MFQDAVPRWWRLLGQILEVNNWLRDIEAGQLPRKSRVVQSRQHRALDRVRTKFVGTLAGTKS